MADFVRERLKDLPVRVLEDGAAAAVGGDSGNLLCVPDRFDPVSPAVALFAHLDTPRPTEGVSPRVLEDRITSDGSTILGVDNRAGTSVLLFTLREWLQSDHPGNFIVVFTVGEELGMLGAKQLDLGPYNVRMGFVFDCSKRPGVYIGSAVGCSLYTATFLGRASHAGVAPEKGVHAIRAAAEAVASIPSGRLSPTMTANIGTIQGGSATNIVPESCSLEGEVRGFDPSAIEAFVRETGDTFSRLAASHGASVRYETSVDFAPFVLDRNSELVRCTETVLRRAGLTPQPIEYLGGSDANTFNEKGIPSVNLGIGAQNPHGNDEFILLEDLHKAVQIASGIIAETSHP
jgi:tripeptide aminopeptidase